MAEPILMKLIRWFLIIVALVFLSPIYFCISWWRPPCADRRKHGRASRGKFNLANGQFERD